MKKHILILIITLTSIVSGCSAYRAPVGVGFDNVTMPLENTVSSKFEFTKNDYEILGQVSSTATSRNALFILAWGDNGYEELKKEAKKQYPEMDDIINIRVDSKHLGILFYLYNQIDLTLTGTAIKYKK